jgi:ribosomal protein S18 acetylase RimI-like enzyme
MHSTQPVATILEEVTIRPLKPDDLHDLEWEGEYAHFRLIYQNTFQRCREGKALSWVAIHSQHGLIGQVFIQLECDRPELADGSSRAYLFSFRIKPNYRNQGLGTRILTIVEAEITHRGYQKITLNVARENLGAIRLYSRLGYQITAPDPGLWSYPDEKGAWHEVVEPSWRMEKELGPATRALLVK